MLDWGRISELRGEVGDAEFQVILEMFLDEGESGMMRLSPGARLGLQDGSRRLILVEGHNLGPILRRSVEGTGLRRIRRRFRSRWTTLRPPSRAVLLRR